MFLADLHVHSKFSDGSLTIPELIDFYGERGFGAIAVTDHLCEKNTLLGIAARYLDVTLNEKSFPRYMETIEKEAQRAWRKYRMVVIPGFELTKNSLRNHRSAHILGLGVKEFVTADKDAVDLARAIRAQNALAIAAHPVATGKAEIQTLHLWNRREELKHEFDAWEVASGTQIFNEVLRSGLPMLATSDFHTPKNINGWKTKFYCERDPEAILQAIRKQDINFQFYKEHHREIIAVG
jgi:predicted metal-dependent phosphoesterase TrpH